MISLYTFNEIDRGIFENIRVALVDAGLLPDITQYNTEDDYTTAKRVLSAQLTSQGKELVELFGVGASHDRDEKTFAKIVINRKTANSGTLGGAGLFYYEKWLDQQGHDRYRKLAYPEQSRTITYEIRCIAASRSSEVTMTNTLYKVLGQKRSIATVSDNDIINEDKKFFISYNGDIDVSIGGDDFLERLFSYIVPDVFLDEANVVNPNIAPMTSVNWCIKIVGSTKDFVPANVQATSCGDPITVTPPVVLGSFELGSFDNSFE